jgi:hypothetical protein
MWQGGRPSPSADVAAPSLSVLSSGTLAGRGALASQPGGRAGVRECAQCECEKH